MKETKQTEKATDPVSETDGPKEHPITPEVEEMFAAYNYMIGTQAFNPNYQFTDKLALSEISGRIVAMGSNMVKFYATNDRLIDILHEEFPQIRTVFMWYRSDPIFRDGMNETETKAEYNACYKYACKLLKDFNGEGMTFYIGHWEGDWYYLTNYDTSMKKIDDVVTQGMIDWINIRQKAIDDAKRDNPDSDVKLWNYIEINRPTDAAKNGVDRVVNRVLPETNVDYVSYSAYDCMNSSKSEIRSVISYITKHLPKKEGVPGDRVFIGEFGQPAANVNYNDTRHRDENLAMFAKFLSCKVKYVLIWQMYCNEWADEAHTKCRGFWLIDQRGKETKLYKALSSILAQGKEYVRNYYIEKGELPTEEEYRAFLLTTPELKGKA